MSPPSCPRRCALGAIGVTMALVVGGCDDCGSSATSAGAGATSRTSASTTGPAAASSASARSTRPPLDSAALGSFSRRCSIRQAPTGDAGVGDFVAALKVHHEAAHIRLPDRKRLHGEPRGGSRRYLEAKQLVAKVKRRGNPFEVRSPLNTLLWKVWLWPDRVELSNTDSAEQHWTIRAREEGGHQAYRDKTLLGSVEHDPARKRVTVRDAKGTITFHGDSEHPSTLFALLLFDDIPWLDRHIIMAEILARGR